ncbi:precorrin-2 C(20)-methyltransferase [Ferroplasma sp.]|uniref:precorrin-2 C(20)-methyltransferase n=1 Tax=Ferroplasma sp. TaxID=2591003 RepID=UPI00307D8137
MEMLKVVGLGPGDPELLTIKGYNALLNADIIFYPKTSLNSAENILNLLKIDKEKIKALEFPIGSDKIPEISKKYAEMIMGSCRKGLKTAYAVEGEPMLYSTFLDIMPYINMEFTIIPGISSMNGISAAMKIMLATKDQDLLVLPAINNYEYMESKIMSSQNIVIFKAIRAKKIIKEILEKNSINDFYIMSNVSTEKERAYNNINDIKDYMTVVVIKRYI